MRNLILILLVFGFNTFSYSYNAISNKKNALINNPEITTTFCTTLYNENCDLKVSHLPVVRHDLLGGPCTVRLDMKLEDGTTIVGTVIFDDVSWWNCSKMQLAAWWNRNF